MELTTRSLPCPEGTKLCPFCGGNPILDHEPDDAVEVPRPTWAVRCRSCAAQGPWSKISAASAVRDWNTRADVRVVDDLQALAREVEDFLDLHTTYGDAQGDDIPVNDDEAIGLRDRWRAFCAKHKLGYGSS